MVALIAIAMLAGAACACSCFRRQSLKRTRAASAAFTKAWRANDGGRSPLMTARQALIARSRLSSSCRQSRNRIVLASKTDAATGKALFDNAIGEVKARLN